MLDGDDDDNLVYSISDDDFQHFPDEIRIQLEALADDGRTVLDSVDKQIDRAGRLMHARVDLLLLTHIKDRLGAFRFSRDLESIHENELLTTAFIVTYARIHQSPGGKFQRGELPERLRKFHDEIMELRNKRFAHTDDHPSITLGMRVVVKNQRFEMVPEMNISFTVGGRSEWRDLIDAIEEIFSQRSAKLIEGLGRKTGRDWAFAELPDGVEAN